MKTKRKKLPPTGINGYFLKQWRLVRQLTQEEVAEAAGIRRATVNDLEMGKHVPRPETVEKLCEALLVSEEQLKRNPFAHWQGK